MFIATCETRNFDFLAVGRTAEEARESLLNGWRRHCQQTGAEHDHVTEEDINIDECQPGQCLRDHQRIT